MGLCWHSNLHERPMFSTLLTMLQEMVLLAKVISALQYMHSNCILAIGEWVVLFHAIF